MHYILACKQMFSIVQAKIKTISGGTNTFMSAVAVWLHPDPKHGVKNVLLMQHGHFPIWGVKQCTK